MISPAESYRTERAGLIGPNRFLLVTALVAVAVALGAPSLLGAEALIATPVGILVALLAYNQIRARTRPHFARGLLEVDHGGVRWEGETLAARDRITQGLALPLGGGCLVRLERPWPKRSLEIAVWSEEEGRRLLAALGLDASQTVAEMPAMSGFNNLPRSTKMFTAGLAGASWVLGNLLGQGFWVLLVLGLIGTVALGRQSRIRIGIDGIHHRWLWRSEFIRFEEVTQIRSVVRDKKRFIDLEMKSGAVRRLALAPEAEEEESFAYRRIQHAYVAYLEREKAGDIEALARGGRTTEAWLDALRRVAVGANVDMRTAHVSLEKLWSLVEDPSAQPSARAGAAASLASVATEDDRKRIRVAAATIAEPKLRLAIERVAEPDIEDEALAEALESVEEPDTKRFV